MSISEKKMKIVIDNYFKSECNVDTSIREAFEKGFRIGVRKGLALSKADTPQTDRPSDDDETIQAIHHLQKVGWLQEHDRILTKQTDDAYFRELMDAVERGEMSDATANQAWYEYISKEVEESDVSKCDACKHNGEYAYCRLCGRPDEDNYEPRIAEGSK